MHFNIFATVWDGIFESHSPGALETLRKAWFRWVGPGPQELGQLPSAACSVCRGVLPPGCLPRHCQDGLVG